MACDKAYQVHERQHSSACSKCNIQIGRVNAEILAQRSTHSQLNLVTVVVDSLGKTPNFVVFDRQTDISIIRCSLE